MRVFASLLVIILTVSNGVAQEAVAPPIRVVFAPKGWTVAGRQLKGGDNLSAIAEVTGSGPDANDLVLDCGKAGSWAYVCKSGPCRIAACSNKAEGASVQQIGATDRKEGKGFFASFLRREPAPLAVLGVRAGGHANDAIVLDSNGQVHIGPALNRVLEGKYCFRFTPVPAGGASGQTLTIDWDRSIDSEGVAPAPNIKSGLYQLEKGSPGVSGACSYESDPTPAWTLVANDTSFAPLQKDWKSYAGQIQEMQDSGASPTVMLLVRHAILANLADETASKW